MGDWTKPFDKPNVSVKRSNASGYIEDLIKVFRDAGPAWSERLTGPYADLYGGADRTQLGRYLTPTQIQGGIFDSPEAKQRYASVLASPESEDAFTANAYRSLFGREASPWELNLWRGNLEANRDPAAVLRDMVSGPEYATMPSDQKARITNLYQAALGRAPEEGAVDTWTKMQGDPMILNQLTRANETAKMLEPIYTSLLDKGQGRLGRDVWKDESDLADMANVFLKTAKDPLQDELTNYYRDKYTRGVESRLASRGLIGQGRGENLESEALRDFEMSALDRSDQRRIAATQAADAVRGSLTSRDLANLNAALAELSGGAGYRSAATGVQNAAEGNIVNAQERNMRDLAELGNYYFDFYGRSLSPAEFLTNYEGQKYSQEAQLKAAGITPFQENLNYLKDMASIAGAAFGMAGGGGGGMMGGGGSSTPAVPPFNYSPGGVTAGYPGGGGSYGFSAPSGSMTPWGTPTSGYSFGPAGGYSPTAYPSFNVGPVMTPADMSMIYG